MEGRMGVVVRERKNCKTKKQVMDLYALGR